jgi:hypothetical protein
LKRARSGQGLSPANRFVQLQQRRGYFALDLLNGEVGTLCKPGIVLGVEPHGEEDCALRLELGNSTPPSGRVALGIVVMGRDKVCSVGDRQSADEVQPVGQGKHVEFTAH